MSKQFKSTPECIYGGSCKLVCVNPQCRKPGFICQNGMVNKQQCALFHENCQKMKWNQLENILYESPHTKIPQFTRLLDQMQLFFSETLKKVKDEHVKFKIWSRTYGYSEQLMNFIHIINDGKFNQISGVYMNQILAELFMKEQNKITSTFNLDIIHKIQQQINAQLGKISEIYNGFQNTSNSKLDDVKEILETQQQVFDSKITDQVDYIKSLFLKQPKQFKLLYRASDCDFSVAQFHNRCDTVPHTLLLVKTQFGKIIGGYTPLPWNSSKKHWAADKSLTSFIFSLDMRQRFQLNLMQFAVACNPDKGPIFGCCDICIVDKSNIEKSNAQFPISYNNFKYTRNPNTSISFTGSQNGKFCTKQWEIFHVQFDQE